MNDFLQSLRINKERRSTRGRRPYDGNSGGNLQGGYDNSGNRHGNERRSPKPAYQKDYNHRDNNQRDRREYSNQDNRQSNDYRPPRQQPSSPFTSQTVDTLLNTIGEILENQKDQLYIQEQKAIAEDRKVAALESIATYLQILVSDTTEPDTEKSVAPEAEQTFVREIETPEPVQEKRPVVKKAEPIRPSAIKPIQKKTIVKNDLKNSTAKKLSGKITPQMRIDIMEIIEKMRSEGATFDEVARHLASLNLPTFSGRGDWHAQTVHRLCNKK